MIDIKKKHLFNIWCQRDSSSMYDVPSGHLVIISLQNFLLARESFPCSIYGQLSLSDLK